MRGGKSRGRKMGMTIDESKQLLSDYQRLFNSLNGDYKLSQVQISELSHSISTAIDTMRKYQMIEEIYKNWCYPTYFNATDAMNKLGEVLKDGND